MSSPTLLGLPAELQALIAQQLDDEGLRTIRHTCRELAANTADVFGQRFFVVRVHLYTMHSLAVLLKISETPRLAHHIGLIVLVVVNVVQPKKPSHLLTMKERSDINNNKYWYEKECRNMRAQASKTLSVIFGNFKELDVGHELELTANLWDENECTCEELEVTERHDDDCEMYKRLTGVYGAPHFLSKIHPWAAAPDVECQRFSPLAQDVNNALIRSGHKLTHLDLGYLSGHVAQQCTTVWNICGSQLAKLALSWATLKTLELTFGDANPPESFSVLLRAATGLAELSIVSVYSVYLHTINQTLRKNQLTRLSLSGSICHSFELVRFIARQAKSLKSLTLDQVLLGSGMDPNTWQSWRAFFGVAAQRLALSTLNLFDLHIWSMRLGDRCDDEFFLCDGRTSEFEVTGDESDVMSRMTEIVEKGVFWETNKVEGLEDEVKEKADEEDQDDEGQSTAGTAGGSDASDLGDEEGAGEEAGDEEGSEDDFDEEKEFAEDVAQGLVKWDFYAQL